jgi:hypothetical protein
MGFLTPVFAQDEAALKKFFEGKFVGLKIDMPATERGVDVFPQRESPVDYTDYGDRIKKHGAAIRIGEQAMITKIRVKEKHIEFQLGGGGYGTFWDESADVSVPYEDKSEREKSLEKAVKNETDPQKKKEMEKELDELRDARERENRRLEADAEQRRIQKEQQIRDKALAAGSRFNIRHDRNMAVAEMTPEYIIDVLANFVYFPPEVFGDNPSAVYSELPAAPPSEIATLQKGMSWEEVSALFGMPKSLNEAEETLKVTTTTFEKDDQIIETKFVNGVLVHYRVSSK